MKANSLLSHTATATTFFICWLIEAQSAVVTEGLVAPSPDQIHSAVAADQGRIHYRRNSDNSVEQTFYLCHAQALAFADNGNLLAASGGSNGSQAKIKVWSIADHKQLCEIITTGDGATALAVSGDGSVVVGAGLGRRVEAWNVIDGRLRWSREIAMAAKSVRFSPDGKKLLLQFADGTEREIDPANGRNVTQRESAKQ